MADHCASRRRSSGVVGRLDLHGVGVRGAMLRRSTRLVADSRRGALHCGCVGGSVCREGSLAAYGCLRSLLRGGAGVVVVAETNQRSSVGSGSFRDCRYRTEKDYSDCWSDRTYDLSQLRGVDFFLDNWGIKFASHPMVSFDFGDQHLAFSIEARYRPGQSYSLFRGFYRQFGLIVVAADESDVIRLRTNYRKDPDEDVYLYRVQVTPAVARAMLMIYVNYMNNLKDNPEWYNELDPELHIDGRQTTCRCDREPAGREHSTCAEWHDGSADVQPRAAGDRWTYLPAVEGAGTH